MLVKVAPVLLNVHFHLHVKFLRTQSTVYCDVCGLFPVEITYTFTIVIYFTGTEAVGTLTMEALKGHMKFLKTVCVSPN